MLQGARRLPGVVVNEAQLVVGHRQVVHGIGGQQGQRLLVIGQGGVEVGQQVGLGAPAARASWNRS
jgi:hypothetical protein